MPTPDHPLYDWFGLNAALFGLINAVHAPLLDRLMLAASGLGHPRMFAFYIAVALWLSWRRPDVLPWRNTVVFAFGYAVLSQVLVPILKGALDFPRPITVLGAQARVLGENDALHALPSGHATFAVLLACALTPGMPRPARVALTVFAVLVCVSRVSVGAHFPADVAWGAVLAALTVAALQRVFRADDGSPRAR